MRNNTFFDLDWDSDEKTPAAARECEHTDCDKDGEHRAPKSRNALNDYYWFCLEHVRAYNAHWDFFAGMDESEIEQFRDRDVTWHRPTWKLGANGAKAADINGFRDDFGLFGNQGNNTAKVEPEERQPKWRLAPDRKALAVLNLSVYVTAGEIKIRYKELVKRFHPDANGGAKDAEDRLKDINQAYSFLMSRVRARG
ncbi:MAG: J domain-containing protein [Proteobacteria bacterium]|nr:J domain-containing protein [Pseudomonadota bacterium]